MQTAVLETIVEKKNVPESFFFRQSTGLVSIRTDDHRYVLQTLPHQQRFVAPLFPRRSLKTDDEDAPAQSSITARQDHWTESALSQIFCERNGQRGLAGSTQREIADADHGMM